MLSTEAQHKASLYTREPFLVLIASINTVKTIP